MWEIVAAIGTLVAAAAAAFAALSARLAADRMLKIESDRLHHSLEPTIVADLDWSAGEKSPLLVVHFEGPQALVSLDKLTCSVLDDRVGRPSDQIWSAYRFRPGTNCNGSPVIADGREIALAGPIRIDDPYRIQMEATTPPVDSVYNSHTWVALFGEGVRVQFESEKAGYDPWVCRTVIPTASG